MNHPKACLFAAAAALAIASCGPAINVRTAISPDASVAKLRTFRILPAPERRGRSPSSDDPMLMNSITNRVLRDALQREFENRGYVNDERNPDFTVAYYASAREKLDVTQWDYGYPWRPGWWRGWGRGGAMVTQFTEGTVIVDVVDPTTRDLLWRARGVAAVSDDPQRYHQDLKGIIAAIVVRFPRARTATVAQRR